MNGHRLRPRALSLNPSCAAAHYFGAHINGFGGRDVAVTTAHASRRAAVSTFDLISFEAHLALALAAIKEARDTPPWAADPRFDRIGL